MSSGRPATDAVTSARLSRQRRAGTAPEIALRKELHRRGRRYFVDRAPLPGLRRRADLVFPRQRVAVYVDGCFWHCCPKHSTVPATNRAFWKAKLSRNKARDVLVNRRLKARGWIVLRIWQHELSPNGHGRLLRRVLRALRTGTGDD